MDKIKEYDTNIKPTNIPYTAIQRNALTEKLMENSISLFTNNEDGSLVETTENNSILEVATQLSNNTYRLENPFVTDLCCNIYTLLTTLPNRELKQVFQKLTIVKGNARFWISKDLMIKLSLGNLVNQNNNTIDGAERVRKTIIDTLMPIFNRKKLVPDQIVNIHNLKLEDGKTASFTFKSAPIRIISEIINNKNGEVGYEVELNGVFYPLKQTNNRKLIANTRYLHTVPNLACLLAIGEDMYLNSEEYQKIQKPFNVRAEIARRFIDILQLSYNQKFNLPNTKAKKIDNKFILEVWGDTLKSLYPKAFKPKNKIYKTEFIKVANLASKYFHYGLEFINKTEIVKENEHLLIPDKENFCKFYSEKAVFTASID